MILGEWWWWVAVVGSSVCASCFRSFHSFSALQPPTSPASVLHQPPPTHKHTRGCVARVRRWHRKKAFSYGERRRTRGSNKGHARKEVARPPRSSIHGCPLILFCCALTQTVARVDFFDNRFELLAPMKALLLFFGSAACLTSYPKM